MKRKITALLLALMLISGWITVSGLTGVFAASYFMTPGEGEEQDVTVSVIAPVEADALYDVDLAWDELTFTYTYSLGTWNPETHTLINVGGSWSEDKQIRVTNHSNVAVRALLVLDYGEESSVPDAAFTGAGEITVDSAVFGEARTGNFTLSPDFEPPCEEAITELKIAEAQVTVCRAAGGA